MQADLDAAIATTNSFSLQVEELEAFKTKPTRNGNQQGLPEGDSPFKSSNPSGMRKMPWQGCSAQNRQHAYTSKSQVRLRSFDQCINVGLCQVNLWESLQGPGDEANDMLQTELVVMELGADQGPIGKLHIIVEGIKMLHQILSNLDCLQHK
ncbi:unnamed protein product [Sphagnum jensenii]|uniref:RPGRIP1 C-terminal domain-containing protein n=1 Tax=Sphagnum jensenii TaxID=128206 RepID=A0ABP0W137_9BRYO